MLIWWIWLKHISRLKGWYFLSMPSCLKQSPDLSVCAPVLGSTLVLQAVPVALLLLLPLFMTVATLPSICSPWTTLDCCWVIFPVPVMKCVLLKEYSLWPPGVINSPWSCPWGCCDSPCVLHYADTRDYWSKKTFKNQCYHQSFRINCTWLSPYEKQTNILSNKLVNSNLS